MTDLQHQQIVDTLEFDIEWKKLIATKKRHLSNPKIQEQSKDILRLQINRLIDDLHWNEDDIKKLLNTHLPPWYMIQIRQLLTQLPK
jgi:hypothetical protein